MQITSQEYEELTATSGICNRILRSREIDTRVYWSDISNYLNEYPKEKNRGAEKTGAGRRHMDPNSTSPITADKCLDVNSLI